MISVVDELAARGEMCQQLRMRIASEQLKAVPENYDPGDIDIHTGFDRQLYWATQLTEARRDLAGYLNRPRALPPARTADHTDALIHNYNAPEEL